MPRLNNAHDFLGLEELKKISLLRACAGECIGTAVLVMTGCGANAILGVLPATALAFGLALAGMIHVSAGKSHECM